MAAAAELQPLHHTPATASTLAVYPLRIEPNQSPRCTAAGQRAARRHRSLAMQHVLEHAAQPADAVDSVDARRCHLELGRRRPHSRARGRERHLSVLFAPWLLVRRPRCRKTPARR
eukprot:scaffold175051_cov27-Tisochrysis_lutea.AAC.3